MNGAAKYAVSGNFIRSAGDFIEEGYVDLTRVKAMEGMQRHTLGKHNYADEHMGVQFSNQRKKRRFFKRPSDSEQQLVIPARYATALHANEEKPLVGTSIPNLAAYGIDLIDQAQPGFFDQLTASRKEPAEYAKVARVINALRPGLYQELRGLQYTSEDFRTGIQLIKDAVR